MKSLKCDRCNIKAKGETFDDWMKDLMPHYMKAHADFMKDPNHTKEDKQKWMAKNEARFNAI